VRDDERTDAVEGKESGVVQPSGIEQHVPLSSHRGRGGVGGGAAACSAFVTRREVADGLRSGEEIFSSILWFAIIETNLIGSHHGLNVSHCWPDGSRRWLVVAIAIAGSKGAVMSCSMGAVVGSMGAVMGSTEAIMGSRWEPSLARWEPTWARWEPLWAR